MLFYISTLDSLRLKFLAFKYWLYCWIWCLRPCYTESTSSHLITKVKECHSGMYAQGLYFDGPPGNPLCCRLNYVVLYFNFWFFKYTFLYLNFICIAESDVYGHATLKPPVLIWSLKFSSVRHGYDGNPLCCILLLFYVLTFDSLRIYNFLHSNFVCIAKVDVYDHTTLKAPVLICSLKLSSVGQGYSTLMGDHLGIPCVVDICYFIFQLLIKNIISCI